MKRLLVNIDPPAGFLGGAGSIDDFCDLKAIFEGGPAGRSCGNCLQKVTGLDDQLVLIAGSVAGALAEPGIVGMTWIAEDLSEAGLFWTTLLLIEPEGVLVFLIKSKSTFGSCNLIDQAHFFAQCDAAEQQVTGDPALERAHELPDIIINDILQGVVGPVLGRARFENCLDLRA